MAVSRKKIQKGIRLKSSTEATTLDGEIRNDGTNLKANLEGSEREVVTADQTQTLDNKTITSPALNGSLSGTALDTDVSADSSDKVPTTQAVKATTDAVQGSADAAQADATQALADAAAAQGTANQAVSDAAAAQSDATQALSDAAAAQATANAAIPSSEKGAASGVATLDGSSKVPSAQISEVLNVNDLADSTISSPANNEVLTYNGTSWVNAPAQSSVSALDDLSDVDAPTPTDGQALVYNGTSGNWEAQDQSGGNSLITTTTVSNNSSDQDVTGFIFDKATNIAGIYSYSCYRKTDSNEVIEVGTIHIGHRPSADTLGVTQFSGVDDAGIEFDINESTGQVTYTTNDITGANYTSELKIEREKEFATLTAPPVGLLNFTASADSTGTFTSGSNLLTKTSVNGWDLSVRTDEEASAGSFSVEITLPVVFGQDVMFGINNDVGAVPTNNNPTYGIYHDAVGSYTRTDGTNFFGSFDTTPPTPAAGDSFRWEISGGDLILSHKPSGGSFSQIHNYGPVSYPAHFEWKPFTSGQQLQIDSTTGLV